MHGYCLVTERGIEALAALPAVEIGKIPLLDIRGLNLHIDKICALLEAAEERERG